MCKAIEEMMNDVREEAREELKEENNELKEKNNELQEESDKYKKLSFLLLQDKRFAELQKASQDEEFCKKMCTDPIFPEFPVYGSNNWYYAYGDSSEEEILSDTDYILKLTEGVKNPPFMVIDD